VHRAHHRARCERACMCERASRHAPCVETRRKLKQDELTGRQLPAGSKANPGNGIEKQEFVKGGKEARDAERRSR